MSTPSHQDYYQVTWEALVKQSLKGQFAQNLAIATVIFLSAESFIYFLMQTFKLEEMNYLWLAAALGIVVIYGSLLAWYIVNKNLVQHVWHSYKVTANGIYIDNKLLEYERVKIKLLLEKLEGSQPLATDRQGKLHLDIPLYRGRLSLLIPNSNLVPQISKALHHYLS